MASANDSTPGGGFLRRKANASIERRLLPACPAGRWRLTLPVFTQQSVHHARATAAADGRSRLVDHSEERRAAAAARRHRWPSRHHDARLRWRTAAALTRRAVVQVVAHAGQAGAAAPRWRKLSGTRRLFVGQVCRIPRCQLPALAALAARCSSSVTHSGASSSVSDKPVSWWPNGQTLPGRRQVAQARQASRVGAP